MVEQITKLLLDSQNPDGGWGATKGKRSNTESTSLAIIALEALKPGSKTEHIKYISGGVKWLTQRQNADGSWPLNDSSKLPSWSTAVAMLALGLWPEYESRAIDAANWVLRLEGSKPGLLANLLLALSFKKKAVHLNEDLIGWPWISGTFSWVEPTSYYLIALKKLRSKLAGTNAEERIKQGELMIYDRICQGGGWNYGNSTALGDGLWPYPDTTAIALIALQDRAEAEANRQSLRALQEMLKDVHSGLALSWSVICLSLYGQDTTTWKELLAQDFEKTRFIGETKSVALSVLALSDGAKYFRV
jgi:Prenyltransferase and squalene oxidase repeat